MLSIIVGISLAGLILVQVVYLKHAYDRELNSFTENVNGAMRSVVRKLETREAWTIVNNIVFDSAVGQGKGVFKFRLAGNELIQDEESVFVIGAPGAFGDSMHTPGDSIIAGHGKMKLQIECDSIPGGGTNKILSVIMVDSSATKTGLLHRTNLIDTASVAAFSDSSAPAPFLERRYIIEKVLDDLDGRTDFSITERIVPADLDSIIAVTLIDAGIETEYAYGISSDPDSIFIAVPDKYSKELIRSDFRTRLFPHDIISRNDELLLYFPAQSSYLIGQEKAFLVLALISIALVTGCFIYVIRIMFRHRRFSGLLVDFINNMTHEFKTPVSTLAIVGENLGDSGDNRIKEYSRIIGEESNRMKRQIEKILEMAALEEGDLNLTLKLIDLHDILNSIVNAMEMRIESSGGVIETNFYVDAIMIEADETHFTNAIYNLLDNAVKYSRDSVRIEISTSVRDEYVNITVEDNGIGIDKSHAGHIFERYYRIPTGNLHDVKGFGLGLSYVKLIVEAHGGSIKVNSAPGRGSAFTITLPIYL